MAFGAARHSWTPCEPSLCSWPAWQRHWSTATGTGCSNHKRKPAARITWPSWRRSSSSQSHLDIIYVYTAILDKNRIYYVAARTTCITSMVTVKKPPIPSWRRRHLGSTLRRALEQHEVTVDREPVKEAVRTT